MTDVRLIRDGEIFRVYWLLLPSLVTHRIQGQIVFSTVKTGLESATNHHITVAGQPLSLLLPDEVQRGYYKDPSLFASNPIIMVLPKQR